MLLKGDPRLYRNVECFTIIHWRPCSNIRHQCYQQIFPSYWNYHINHAVFVSVSYGHYNDVVMGSMVSQITSLAIVYSAVYSGADQRKHQSSASLVFVRGFHRGPVNYPHKWPVTRKMLPFDDVIMDLLEYCRRERNMLDTIRALIGMVGYLSTLIPKYIINSWVMNNMEKSAYHVLNTISLSNTLYFDLNTIEVSSYGSNLK